MEDFENNGDDLDDPMLCRALWLSVIAQALVDAKSRSRKTSKRRDRLRAIAWLSQSGNGSDFSYVCELAGVRPQDVRNVLKGIREGNKTVDFRCLRKPKWIDRLFIREQLNTNHNDNKGENNGNR